MSHWQRVAIAVVCCGLLFGSFVHYEAAVDDREPYPDNEDVLADYEEFVGERTLLFGTVQSVDGDRMEIRVDTDSGPLAMTVDGADAAVRPGGVVQVYGTLGPGGTMTADRTVVVNGSGGAGLVKYGVSVVGAVLVLVAVFRHWRIDAEAREVRPRG